MRKVRDTRAKLDIQTGTAKADLTTIAAKFATLGDKNVTLNVTTGQAETRVESIDTRLMALKMMSPVKIEVRVDHDDVALNRIRALVVAARGLATERPNVRVTADTAGALAQMTALLASVRRLSEPEHQIRIRLEETSVLSQLSRIQTELSTLSGGKFEVSADTRQAMMELAALRVQLAELQASEQTVEVRAETETARRQIRDLENHLAQVAGRQHIANLHVETSVAASALEGLTDAIEGTWDALETLGKIAAVPLAIPGAFAAAGQIAAVGSAVLDLTGVLGLVPAAGAAGGAAMATFALGLSHVADALGPTGTAAQVKKVNEAVAALSPNAREAVATIRGLGPAFSDMRLEVQQQLFRGVGEEIKTVAGTYLPVMKTGLSGIAEELNLGAKGFVDWIQQGRTITDVNTILGLTRTTMRELAPAGTNVAAALTDIAVVGAAVMPELATGATRATEQFREFIAEARKSGELAEWIRGGIDAVESLGRIAINTGSALGSLFSAADEAGFSFLGTVERLTAEIDILMSSQSGRRALVDTFAESRDAINTLLPGVKELAGATLETTGAFARTDGLERFASLVSQTASAVSPLISELGELAGGTLGALAGGAELAVTALTPVISLTGGLIDVLGPVAPAVLAAVIAFKGLGLVAPSVAALGVSTQVAAASAAAFAGRMTGLAPVALAAGTSTLALGTAVAAVGRALPIVGVAAVGLGLALSSMSTSTDSAVTAMAAGGVAADNMRAALLEQQGASQAGRSGFDDWATSINGWVNSNVFGMASVESTTEAMSRQRSEMTALQRAQQDVTIAQGEYQAALDRFPASSPRVQAAASALADATRRVQIEQIAARNATDLHTAAMIQQSDQAMAATNAGRGYEGALLNLERAQIRAAEATRDHGAGSLEAREANFALEGQLLATATAAGEKARADGIASEAANVDELAARAQKEELLRLADANTGPVRDSLLAAAAAIDISAGASSRAEILARQQKDELGRLADTATGRTADAMRTLAGNFDTLGGASASAEEKARLQEKALRDMAATASGTLRTELNRMADQIRNLPSGSFNVTANGQLGPMFNPDGSFKGSAGRMATGGVWAGPGKVIRAATGAVLPGYTPGRDVHSFASPTGGRLELSGGEAVMRPEWTRAVGPAYVAQANRAAREGGTAGVRRFVTSRTDPAALAAGEGIPDPAYRFASGGIIPTRYTGPVQRFAFGGIVRPPPPYSTRVSQDHRGTAEEAARRMAPVVAAAIKRYEEAAAAAAAGPALTPGGSNFGGVKPHVAAAGHEILRLFGPMPGGIGGVGARANASDHPVGLALDFMTMSNVGLGNRVSDHFLSNFGRLATKYVIWRQRINSGGGWRGMEDRGSPTANHMDHPHVSFVARARGGVLPSDLSRPPRTSLADRGGMIPSGTAALNLSGRAERMLSPRQTEVFERLVAAISSRRGNFEARLGPLPVATPIGSNPMATQLQAAMLAPRPVMTGGGPRIDLGVVVRELAQMRAESRGRPPVVVNQTFPGGQGTTSGSRDAALGIKLALG
ncbi:hypothetical protein I4I77_01225 [Pseudonocardia sp. KRD-188]|nr:hypothetical protein [Pseudonocardia oceani]MBW0088229.1 hypothetical protein [Pseudonocardia oceani]MBW0121136.1 hypothetical protein [Pseudonocardia oceani]